MTRRCQWRGKPLLLSWKIYNRCVRLEFCLLITPFILGFMSAVHFFELKCRTDRERSWSPVLLVSVAPQQVDFILTLFRSPEMKNLNYERLILITQVKSLLPPDDRNQAIRLRILHQSADNKRWSPSSCTSDVEFDTTDLPLSVGGSLDSKALRRLQRSTSE